MSEPRDPPYPELKRSHTMARTGRPFSDHKPPSSAPVWAAVEGLGRYYILLAAVDLGVFDALDRRGPCSAEALAGELGCPVDHLRTLLDGVVTQGFLERHLDAGGDIAGSGGADSDGAVGSAGVAYDLNDTARRYLVSNSPASMAALIGVAPGPHENWTRLAETVRDGRPATPIDDDPAAFYVPLVEGTFATMLRCAGRADLKLRYSALTAPRLLDLGAGGAPWTIAVLAACDQATATVNDLEGVIEVARAKTAEHGVADRCEFRAGDYHEIPIESAAYDIAVLGHVCRAEGAAGARRLIARAHEALALGGQLLLADYFVDPERRSPAVVMGATMMASTVRGFTYTHAEVSQWLAEAGFTNLRLIEPIGFQQVFVARKPSSGRAPEPSQD